MIKHQKITRITICIIALVMCTGFSFAKGGDDDEKEKLKEKEKLTVVPSDSANTNLDVNAANHVDDTLVFEDWDGQEGGSDDDGGAGEADSGLDGKSGISGKRNVFGSDINSEVTAKNESSPFSDALHTEYQIEFKIYPNPTVDYITIQPNIIPRSIRITDITGKTHRDEGYSSNLDVAELPSGTYILSLIYADHIEARRFIKR
jgi:hypothetical protein